MGAEPAGYKGPRKKEIRTENNFASKTEEREGKKGNQRLSYN